RPYSFNRIDRRAGEIELIVKPLGPGGEWIAARREGGRLELLGPLGSAFVVHRSTRNLLLVAGGTGIAPMRVLAEQESARRNVTVLMGGRSVAHLWPSDLLPATVEYVTTTEDGSFGITGRVTDAIAPLLEWADQLCACGPWPMLAALGRLRDEADRASAAYPGRRPLLDAQIAVEQHMGCAMGVCRACVVVTAQGNARRPTSERDFAMPWRPRSSVGVFRASGPQRAEHHDPTRGRARKTPALRRLRPCLRVASISPLRRRAGCV